ncbi:unnamed protein product, partial [Closterium sp. NIES-54]
VLLVALLTHPSLRGVPPPPLPPPTLLLLLLTSLVLRRSGLLLLLVGSAAAARAREARVVAVAAGVVMVEAVEAVEVAEVAVGVVAGVGASVAAVVAAVGVVVAVVAVVGVVVAAVVAVRVELFRDEVLAVARGSSSSVGARPLCPSSFVSGLLSVGRLGVVFAARMSFAQRTRWLELLRSGVDIFALDYDDILAAMYTLTVSAEGDCYLCVPPGPGIEPAAQEFALPGTAPAEALHTFMLDSGASRCFFRDSTTLTPLPALVPVRLADPSRGPVLAHSSTVLPCPAYRCPPRCDGHSGGAETEGAKPGGAESEGAESGGAEPKGTASAGGPAAGGPTARGTRAGGAGATSPGGAGVTAGDPRAGGAGARGAGAGGTRAGGAGAGGAGGGGARAGGAGARGTRARGAGAGGAGAGGAGFGGTGAGGTVQQQPFFVPPPPSSLLPFGSVLRQPESPLPAPSPYAEQTDSLTERREPESRPALPVRAVRTGRHVPRPRPPPVPGTHIMALRPSSVPLRVPLPSPPASSLADGPDLDSDLVLAASPTVTCLLATVVTDPSFESSAGSALVTELVEFAAACPLDYAASLVAESASDCPLSVGGECALGTDVLDESVFGMVWIF